LDHHPGLSPEEKSFLLQLAREVISLRCRGEGSPQHPVHSKKLNRKFGVFVTLHKGNDLRGCIGYVEGIKPLQSAVIDMANSAAFNDPRFKPVTEAELDHLTIEISVLSALDKVEDINDIIVGRDGLLIEKSVFSGLLLPQVASELGWDRKTFLSQTCIKAGLPENEWKSGKCTIYKFSAEIFSETEIS